MENHQYDVQVDKPDEWVNLWFIGDQHLGSVACEESKLDQDIARILRSHKPHIFMMGDWLQAICHRDKRFDPADVHGRYWGHLGDIFRWQLKDVKQRVAKLQEHTIGAHMGNHEFACSKYFQYDPHAELLETFPKIRDLKNSALTEIRVCHKRKLLYTFVVFSCHKMGNIRTMTPFMNRTKHFKADIKVGAHNHQLEIKEVPTLEQREGKPGGDTKANRQVYAFSGSYLRTYASGQVGYGDWAGYEPVALGCLNIRARRNIAEEYQLELDPRTI